MKPTEGKSIGVRGVTMKLGVRAVGPCWAAIFLCAAVTAAQDGPGDWHLTGADAGQNGWQKAESTLAPDSVRANVKFLWKIQLGHPEKGAESFSEPLLAGRLINAQGFKDIVYWSSGDTLYAVDSELGNLLWKKQFETSGPAPARGCGVSSLDILMEPPPVINFNARRRRPPGTPRPPEPSATQPGERRLGVAPGGGYFGLKGIYVLTADGMLHELVMTTGADFAPPVKFLPAANASPYGLNFMAHTLYVATGSNCGGVPDGLWAIDLSLPNYPVTSYSAPNVRPLALTGPVVSPDGTSFLVTANGAAGTGEEGSYAGSVLAIGKDMKVENWYTPASGMGAYRSVSPILIPFKEKELIVAPGKDGSIALLDSESLGGADHRTPLYETNLFAKPGERHGWDGFAAWQDKDGSTWVFASVSAALDASGSEVKSNGPTPHGGIVAFKVEDASGKPRLTPVWISRDMVNPAPPRIANGVLVALSGGNSSTHATLYMLNAATGEELYSSQDQIPTYTGYSGVSVGDGHAFFTDHDNVLYSFGIGMEH
jgi:hypothetical protein